MEDSSKLEKILKNVKKIKPHIKKCWIKEWEKIYEDLEETGEVSSCLSKQNLSPEQQQRFENIIEKREDIGAKMINTVYEEGFQKRHLKDSFLFYGPFLGLFSGVIFPPLQSIFFGIFAGDAFETGIKRKSGYRIIQGLASAACAGMWAYSFFLGNLSGLEISSILLAATFPLYFMDFFVGKGEKIRPPRKLPEIKYLEKELKVFAGSYNNLMEKYKDKLEWVEGENYERELFDLIDNWGLSEYFKDSKIRTFLKGGGPKKTMLVLGKSGFALGRANPISGKVHMYRDAMKKPMHAHVHFHEIDHQDGGNESRCELDSIRALSYLNELFPNQGYDLESLLTEIRITGHTWAHQRKKEIEKEMKRQGIKPNKKEIQDKIVQELCSMGFPITDIEYFKLKYRPSPIHEIIRFTFPNFTMKALTYLQAVFQREDYRCGYTIGAYRKIQLYKAKLFGRGKYEPKEVKMIKEYKPKARAQEGINYGE